MKLQLKRSVWSGHLDVRGFLFDPALIGEGAAHQRIATLWVPGATVYRLSSALVLRFPTERHIAADAAPGMALVDRHNSGVLLGAPLPARRVRQLNPRIPAVVRGVAGTVIAEPLIPERKLDPAAWLNLDGWSLANQVRPLGVTPAVSSSVEVVKFDLRRELKTTIQPASELLALRTEFEGAAPTPARTKNRMRTHWRTLMLGISTALSSLILRLSGRVARDPKESAASDTLEYELDPEASWHDDGLPTALERHREHQSDSRRVRESGRLRRGVGRLSRRSLLSRIRQWVRRPALPSEDDEFELNDEPESPEKLSRFTLWWRKMLWRGLFRTGMEDVLGRKQARYLSRMLSMFESGDIDAALRHAIPLASRHGDGLPRPALLDPEPRQSLTLSLHSGPGKAGTMPLGREAFRLIRAAYEQAFHRLLREDRIDEAVFVLVELLGQVTEAVSLLEQKGHLRLAARLAEGRKLEPGLVVRQWFIAGDIRRATGIARRTNCFSDALRRLDKHPTAAARLRLQWATSLARAGDYAAAAEVIWELPQHRPQAIGWLEQASDAGGTTAATALIMTAVLVPDRFEQTKSLLLNLLRRRTVVDQPLRTGIARQLLKQLDNRFELPTRQRLRQLARPALRATLADRALHGQGLPITAIKRLFARCYDPALQADRPDDLPHAPAHWPGPRIELEFEADQCGITPITDLLALPDGRFLFAFGEAGCQLNSANGTKQAHFDHPASWLVPNDNGNQVLAIARRGSLVRITRIDISSKRARFWCERPLSCWAPTFDGSLWFVASGESVMAIDCQNEDFRSLWRVPLEERLVTQIARSPRSLAFLIEELRDEAQELKARLSGVEPEEPLREVWRYDLPGLILRKRSATRRQLPRSRFLGNLALTPQGHLTRCSLSSTRPGVDDVQLEVYRAQELIATIPLGEVTLDTLSPRNLEPVCRNDSWLVFRQAEQIRILELPDQFRQARLHLKGATRVCCRLREDRLLIADDRGRVLLFDLQSGRLIDQQLL